MYLSCSWREREGEKKKLIKQKLTLLPFERDGWVQKGRIISNCQTGRKVEGLSCCWMNDQREQNTQTIFFFVSFFGFSIK